jgi:beta-glucosidase
MNRWFLDPLFRGEYPTDLPFEPPIRPDDLATIAAPLDFLGVNYYFRVVAEAGANGDGPPVFAHVPGATYTDMGWEVYPEGLYECLVRVAREYRPRAIHVTENGAAFGDVRLHDGSVSDPERRDFLAGHLDAIQRAIAHGAPVQGYFVWSLLDNFEWANGYAKRFGIVYVDYPTLERVPKESFHWYRDFIAAQREEPVWRASA